MARNRRSQRPAPAELDPLIHERLRLGIICALAVEDALTFTELRDLLETTDGNLSVQARKLEEAGYVSCSKRFVARKPKTTYRLTARGRAALEGYLETLAEMLPPGAPVRVLAGRRAAMHPVPSES